MKTPDPHTTTPTPNHKSGSQVVPKWFPNGRQGNRDESGSPVPLSFGGEPLSEPSPSGSRNHRNHSPHGRPRQHLEEAGRG